MDTSQIINIDLLYGDETVRYVIGSQKQSSSNSCTFSNGRILVHLDHGVLTTQPHDLSKEGLSFGYQGLTKKNGDDLFRYCRLPFTQ
jgi:hypothetical protein